MSNSSSIFRTKNCVEINDDLRGTHNINSLVKFKTTMLKSSLGHYSDAYILVKGTITLIGQGAIEAEQQTDRNIKQVTFKNSALFTDCLTEINDTQIDNLKDLDVVMLMYNLIAYSDNYSWTTARQYHKDKPRNPITDSYSLKLISRLVANTNEHGIINLEIAVPLKYLSNFWRTIEMCLINCEINLIVTWPANYVVSELNRRVTFAIADIKLYVSAAIVLTNDNAKLLQQIKTGF